MLGITGANKVKFFWVVPQDTFEDGSLVIPNSGDFVSKEADHFLIPRPEPTLDQANTVRLLAIAKQFEKIIDGTFLDGVILPPSETLKAIIREVVDGLFPVLVPEADPDPCSS